MEYKISYNMAVELLRSYLEKMYRLEKHKGTAPIKAKHLCELEEGLGSLINQLKEDGYNTDELIRTLKEGLEQKYVYNKLIVNVDGAARGNNDVSIPNISGAGFIIYGDCQKLFKGARYLGSEIELPRLKHEDLTAPPVMTLATNNTAEYIALIEALEYMLEQGLTAKQIEIYSDSRMVVTQVNMIATTKAPHLICLRDCAQQLLSEFDNVTLTHVPREDNEEADRLVNELLDELEQNEGEKII